MIKDNNNIFNLTPKRKAQDLIMDALATCQGYWTENQSEGMSEKEINKTNEQLKKLSDRLAKKMGYDFSWIG